MASSDGSDDYEWQPPTEAEMKVLEARRERSDKISKIMGEYLLKGYKMLSSNCPQCSCILMQDKKGKNYCIACSELDSDTDKDNPALSQEAAQRQVAEEHQRQNRADSPEPIPTPLGATATATTGPTNTDSNANTHAPIFGRPTSIGTRQRAAPVITQNALVTSSGSSFSLGSSLVDVSPTLQVVQAKLLSATEELQASSSIDMSIKLCELIKSCADTLTSLYQLQSGVSSISRE